MKFTISDVEHETLPHESYVMVPPVGVTFERSFTAKRKLRGLGEYITEEIKKQVFVIMDPVADDFVRHEGYSVLGTRVWYELAEAVNIATTLLVSLSGIGPMRLWIMGRDYGSFIIPPAAGSNGGETPYTDFLNDIYHAIDDDRGFNPKEWREAISRTMEKSEG